MDMLLKHGADVNAVNIKQRTPLHLSVNENGGDDSSTEVEAFLIDNGADLFARDCRERLPLHYVFVKIGL
jgi:ankyrin repeat protein